MRQLSDLGEAHYGQCLELDQHIVMAPEVGSIGSPELLPTVPNGDWYLPFVGDAAGGKFQLECMLVAHFQKARA